MTYIPALEKIQIGEEGTYGDGAVATIQLAGKTCRIDPHVEAEQVIDKRGNTMPAHVALVKRRWSEGLISGFLDYETARLWLNTMFTVDASSPHTYLAVLAGQTPGSLSLYYGQTGLLYKVTGVIPSSLSIKGASGEPVTFEYKFFGQAADAGASFAGLSDPAPVFVMGHHCNLYLDPIAGPIGTTALTDLAFRFEAMITCNRKPVWHLGDQVPDSNRQGKWGGSMKLVVEADATRLGYINDILDNTIAPEGYAVRMRATDGSKILDINFAGQALTPPPLISDEDGITTVEFDLAPVYSSDATFLSCWGATLTLP
ncbi:MAG TPA: phage tail tube protein [Anaerolineales bacterium]|nr:phage tail tube protein [Anaerolineales bacterium]